MSTSEKISNPAPVAPVAAVGTSSARANPPLALLAGGAVLLLILAVWGLPLLLNATPAPAPSDSPVLEGTDVSVPDTFDDPAQNLEALKSTLSKEKFLKKLFTVDRSSYDLYEKAAKKLGITKAEVQEFFFTCCDLVNEEAIFADLPPVSPDFSDVAYDVSTGKLYQIGLLDKSIYSQPEFYSFIDQETGSVSRELAFRPWSSPELNQWGNDGMSAYPSDQFGNVDLSNGGKFTAAVFVTNAWNIQNFVGVNLVPNNDTTQYFDISISEEETGNPYFLLGPTFPYFHRNWATRVVIEGKAKPGTPPGEYVVGINPVAPTTQNNEKWANEHPGLYAPYGFIRPSDNYITLTINVSE